MQFGVVHQTTYQYRERVHESYTVVHLQPRSDPSQYCTRFELAITPRTRVFGYVDRFGNTVQHFAVLPDHDHLSIVARSEVVTVRPALGAVLGPTTRRALEEDAAARWLVDERLESGYVAFGTELRRFAAEVGEPAPGDDLVAWLVHAGGAVHRRFTYDKEATTVRTAVDDALRLGRGVCQDFAHLLLALARYHGIPARYVSGYLFSGPSGSVVGAEASHAWVEAYLPPHGWVGFDPTNDTFIDERFAIIAVGRDYHDVSPVRGVYKGASQSTMAVNVEMEALAVAQQ